MVLAILERFNYLFKKGVHVDPSTLIKEGVVRFLEGPKDRNDALNQLVDALTKSYKISQESHFYEAILHREEIVSTGIGMGVAIPHAKMDDFKHFFLAVGVAKEGIEWDALDGAPVRLIFMIGGPSDQQTEYLKILSSLTAAIKDEKRRKNLLNAQNKDAVLAFFKEC